MAFIPRRTIESSQSNRSRASSMWRHRGRSNARGLAPSLLLAGKTQQREQPVGDMVRGGLVPGKQQEHTSRHQLVVGETVAILLEIDQLRQQVVSRQRTA